MAKKKMPPLSYPEPPTDDTGGDTDTSVEGEEGGSTSTYSPLAAGNPREYNATMKMLMEQLVDTPEQYKKNEILAWGGGLHDPSGQANIGASIGNANRAELAFRLKDKELRAQYIPLIMGALGESQKAQASQAIMSEPLLGMTPERAMQLDQFHKGYFNAWKSVNEGATAPGDSYRQRWNPKTRQMEWTYMPKAGSPDMTLDPGTNKPVSVQNVPGSVTAAGQTAGATAAGQEVGKNIAGTTKVLGPNGAPGISPTPQVLPSISDPRVVSQFEPQPPAGNVPPPVPVPPQGEPAGGGTTGPGQGTTGTIPTTLTPAAAVRTVESNNRGAAFNPVSGARGAMQVIDSTNGAPGYGVMPARDNSPEERERVGRDYLAALQKKYGESSGYAAYNMGPGKFEKWRDAGGKWSDLPKETQEYIGKVNLAKEGHSIYGPPPEPRKPSTAAPATVVAQAAPAAAAAPGAPTFVQQELSPGQQQVNKNIGDSTTRAAATYKELMDRAKKFDDEERNINDLQTALPKLGKTGDYNTPIREAAAKVFATFGVEADEKWLKNQQTFQRAIGERVNEKIMSDRGVATEGDADRHRQTEANLRGQPAYNQYVIDVYKANLEMQRAKYNFYNKAYPAAERDTSIGGDTGVVERDWIKRKPDLFDMPSLKKYKKG